MTKFTLPKKMNTNIWNSAQMAGTGGALKALAKNLANQLNLNRTEMKRVVARVLSERHGQGDVGDYNGHMFYVKPERVDLTKQITHSKEAFDEMVNQKRMQRMGATNSIHTFGTGPPARSRSRSRSLNYKTVMGIKPDNGSTGVIIDQNHLIKRAKPSGITVQVSKAMLKSKSKQQIKRKAPAATKKPVKRQIKPKPALGKLKSMSKLNSQIKSNQLTAKKSLVKAALRTVQSKSPITRHLSGPIQRLPAGNTIHPTVLAMKEQTTPTLQPKKTAPANNEIIKKKSIIVNKNKSTKNLSKSKSKASCKKNCEQPWLEQNKKHPKRLRAGGLLTKFTRTQNSSNQKNRSTMRWQNPYQFQGGAGATQRPNPVDSQYHVASPKSKTKNRIAKSTMSMRRIRCKRSEARLLKQLEREEAIDEPERMEAGSTPVLRVKRSPSVHGKRISRPYKMSPRLEELAKPLQHRIVNPKTLPPSRSCSPLRNAKSKLRLRRRKRAGILIDSSLGSIEALKGTSRSGLTPAKRNLTLAFLKGNHSRSPRSPRSVLWR